VNEPFGCASSFVNEGGRLPGERIHLHIRSTPTLQIDAAKILLGGNQTTQVVKKWYDNVVIAKHYIGPWSQAQPSHDPRPV